MGSSSTTTRVDSFTVWLKYSAKAEMTVINVVTKILDPRNKGLITQSQKVKKLSYFSILEARLGC